MDQEDCGMTDVWLVTILILVALIILAFVRLIAGPTPPDRVVALDTVNTLTVASMIILGVIFNEIIFIDVAIVYALLSFVGTLYIAKYLGGEIQ
jgi:multicomponent Na+:H+ antiporter subunit F